MINRRCNAHIEEVTPQWRENVLKYFIRAINQKSLENKVLYLRASTHCEKKQVVEFLRRQKDLQIISISNFRRNSWALSISLCGGYGYESGALRNDGESTECPEQLRFCRSFLYLQ